MIFYEDKPSIEEALLHSGETYLCHYGTPRHSGRYPWGSGEDPYQHSGDFLARVHLLREQNFTYTDKDGKTWTGDTAIAKSMGLNSTQFRTQYTLAKNERRMDQRASALSMKKDGKTNEEIAQALGLKGESSVRSLLNEDSAARMSAAQQTYEVLKKHVDEKGMIDVGTGVERELGISKEKMKEALYMLEREGYNVYGGGVPQATNPGKQTNLSVLCKPGVEHKEIYDYDKIGHIEDYASQDNGLTFHKTAYPASLDSKRLAINYAEDGGNLKDGVIELRRGVKDLDLGSSNYAQVRILVDGNRYLKGMAVYADDLPDGIDVRFNTNKTKDVPKMEVLKDTAKNLKKDPTNPFGALIKADGQSYYTDKNGKQQLGLVNKTREEGDWNEWAKKLPSQFLAKQNSRLVKQQLDLTAAERYAEFDSIMSLTNPSVKKRMLKDFADDCDASAVHLKAAALPRQRYQAILPLTTIGDNEVYAPNYKNGEQLALVRFPHAGTFEIPVLKVNNKNAEGQKMMGKQALDAIGISAKTAAQLSGADFDGDTVMVVPTNRNVKITATKYFDELKKFDPSIDYGGTTKIGDDGKEHYYRNGKEYRVMSEHQKQIQMGVVSNLITDMTIGGATEKELAAAVKHSMVTIDAVKHKLDYKQSYEDNHIESLKKKYQARIDPETGRVKTGAATLLSRAKNEIDIPKRQGSGIIDKETGEIRYKTNDKPWIDKEGKEHKLTQKSTQMAEAKDARQLSSGSAVEELYADYANQMKALGNRARKEMVNTPSGKYDPSAKAKYKKQTDRLDAALLVAEKNAPRERQAQLMANSKVKAMRQANPDMTKSEIKKAGQLALVEARAKVGADGKSARITISDDEWEAIQAGAITSSKLDRIMNHTDMDRLRELATPRTSRALTQGQTNRIRAMKLSGYTNAEIADALHVSSSTVTAYLSENKRKEAS